MIWYLLYPFRGTSEAPVLDPSHYVRRIFAKYGAYAARHVITTLLVSSAVAGILIYPFPFLYTSDFINGASGLPHHVWTVAQPLSQPDVEPDVIMRSIWVHGSFMKALDRDVLLGALDLQDELLGSTEDFHPRSPHHHLPLLEDSGMTDLTPADRDAFHVINGLTNESWFFHSPLQYWSGSAKRIEEDTDILSTVNQKKNQPTSVNITLRHSIVFSGKQFEDRKLTAADALVITLVHLRDSPVGRQWERKAGELATGASAKWTAYPADGRNMASQLYQFQFRPISLQDMVSLGLAYGLALTYFLMSMSKLRAVKSRIGLMITIMSQIILSILSSFTVCAIFKVDLSRIPQAAYPLVVLSMSLENIFRLINSVIATPSEDSTSSRIGHAFGDTAYVALASSAQNVLILWVLSRVVSPGVAAFCTFASIAILFDFFYLSTFFLSVLSVDVRRTELSDALEKASFKHRGRTSEPSLRTSWFEAVLQGKFAISTRIAGTVIMIGFVLIAQWHFFENETILRVLSGCLGLSRNGNGFNHPKESILVDIHQARSPTSWLRLQDHDTAREVINVVKPQAHSYVARVYDPLVFVLKGADRTPRHAERPLLPALYDFIDHHFMRFVVTVFFILAAVRLLMNYLLWEDDAESKPSHGPDEEPLLSVMSLKDGHYLDVALVDASVDGHIVSVGLDRVIRVWDVSSGVRAYALGDIAVSPEGLFPVLAVAIDETCTWLALLSPQSIQTWNLAEHKWDHSIPVDLYGQKPQGFWFGPSDNQDTPPLILVRRGGVMTQLNLAAVESADFGICKSPLVSAEPLVPTDTSSRARGLSILTASRKGCIHVARQENGNWHSQSLDMHLAEDRDAFQVVPLSSLDSFLIVREWTVDLVDGKTNSLIYTFETKTPIQPRSLRCFHSARRKPQCGSVGLLSFGLAYNSAETGTCVIQSYTPKEEGDTICFRNAGQPASRSCCAWSDARLSERKIENPGTWETILNGVVVGVRRCVPVLNTPPVNNGAQDSSPTHSNGLRRRAVGNYGKRSSSANNNSKSRSRSRGGSSTDNSSCDDWEVWIACQSGRQDIYETKPLHGDDIGGRHLIISDLGPMVKVGTASVVVGFGNVLKLITVGHEHFEAAKSAVRSQGQQSWNVGSRRRRNNQGTVKARPVAWT